MAQFDPTNEKLTSGFVVGGKTVYIEAAKISTETYGVAASWPANAQEMSSVSGFVPTIGAVESEIKAKIGTVYKVKGTHTVAATDIVDGQITNLPEAVNGDVYNIALPSDVPNAKIGDQVITNGDNIVYVGADVESPAHWDKLAGAVDTTTFATKEWVNDGTSSGSLPMQMISGAYTTSAAMLAGDDDALVMNAGIKDFVSGYISDNTIKTSTALSAITGAGSTDGDKLVNASAITGYIYDQIQTTIQETIDVVSAITTGAGPDATPLSAVPNVKALTSYIDDNTIKTSAGMVDATDGNDLASVSAIKDYIAAQLAGNISAYNQIIVNDDTALASGYDAVKFVNGDGVTLETDTDDKTGNPTIKFHSNIVVSGSVGTDAATSGLLTVTSAADNGVVKYDISVPDATSAIVGVVRADYYSETDHLIHLF